MIVYLDASALVKRYVREAGSDDVGQLVAEADVIGTSLVTRAEVAAALARAARTGLVERDQAEAALLVFRAEWPRLARIQLTEPLIARADAVAWDHGLRGYDAVHLASALYWQESLRQAVVMATYDRELWRAGEATGLSVWPRTF
ncbi:MAG: type II toxin-antitoxin system VapC family toxin [Anaerolineae bacterium]|jgi:predicted nucleic acid-binding protein